MKSMAWLAQADDQSTCETSGKMTAIRFSLVCLWKPIMSPFYSSLVVADNPLGFLQTPLSRTHWRTEGGNSRERCAVRGAQGFIANLFP